MAKPKHLYRKLFIFWLKENIVTIHNLVYFALVYYYSSCFNRGRWLFGPRILNIVVLVYVVGLYCWDVLCSLLSKLTGNEEEDETKEEP